MSARARDSIVKPFLFSHGTLMCRDMAKSRRFYEEFLGVEVVRHGRPAMMLRLNTNMYVVCFCIGEKAPAQHVMSHWGLEVATRAEVDQAHEAATRLRDVYELKKVGALREQHGAYGFYLQDRDGNWWEIQNEPRTIDDFFDKGDIAPMEVVATGSEESHG
jgi:catechol 2,3-dioxygenase-like lactoylglutathione lyase family enzyme